MADNALREHVAASVRAEMARARYTQQRMARRLGYKTTTRLARRLHGVYPFTLEELGAIAAELGCSISTFIGDEK